jgi:hypothetical protein
MNYLNKNMDLWSMNRDLRQDSLFEFQSKSFFITKIS